MARTRILAEEVVAKAVEAADALVLRLQVIASPTRMRIIGLLLKGGGEVSARDLQSYLKMAQPTISHSLKILLEADIVVHTGKKRRNGERLLDVNREALASLLQDLTRQLRRRR